MTLQRLAQQQQNSVGLTVSITAVSGRKKKKKKKGVIKAKYEGKIPEQGQQRRG